MPRSHNRFTRRIILILWAAASCLVVSPSAVMADVPTAWQLLDDGDPTPGGVEVVYDTVRQREVQQTAGTWELVGNDWVRRFITQPPINPFCSAFDSSRGVMVTFHSNAETWEYDGIQWSKRTLSSSPSGRNHCAMAYDSQRRKVVLFGGYDSNDRPLGDHWEYDGNWVQIFPRNMHPFPPRRGQHAMSYDSDRARTVLFGGGGVSGVILNDTWEYDGTDWKQSIPSSSPQVRVEARMAYDRIRKKTVLFGGYTSVEVFGDTWEWDGSNWTMKNPTSSPAPRWYFHLVFDEARGKILGCGGLADNASFNDTWVYDGTTWTQIAISKLPMQRFHHALAYDPSRDLLVL